VTQVLPAAPFPEPGHPALLDCTLRDGAYEIGFSFTANDTAAICGALSAAGIQWIEVAHGMGLGGGRARGERGTPSDAEHVAAAVAAAPASRVGIIAVPGVATETDLTAVARAGAVFARIGTDITRSHEARPLIEHARSCGLAVTYNAMKSYTVPVAELVRRSIRAVESGAQLCYVVDSAGTLLPKDVQAALRAMRDAGIPSGFHGHDNLGLAVANSLAAFESGAVMVDACLHGVGRGAGNAQTEALAVLVQRLGYGAELDTDALSKAAETFIRPRRERPRGLDGIDIVMGDAQFHSGALPRVREAAQRHGVGLFSLIRQVGRMDPVDPSPQLIDDIAKKMRSSSTKAVVD
jgi:4-hydroxy 2-oxovalerate aldolase